MAVSGNQDPNLTPAYGLITEQLKQRANLELQRPSPLDIGTTIVNRADKELTANREFEKKLLSEGRKRFTPEMGKQLLDEIPGLTEADISGDYGLYLKPEDLESRLHQKVAMRELAKTLSPEENAVLNATGEKGQTALANKTFEKQQKPVGLKPVKDEASPTGFSYKIINPDGTVIETHEPAPDPTSTSGGAQQRLKERTLLNSFLNQSKQFKDVASSLIRVRSSAKDPSGAGDLSMIFAYMKMLDPTSVVRESEQATAENARGVPEALRALYNKVLNGQKLSEKQRADFLDRAEKIYMSEDELHAQREDEFKRLAILSDINPEKVVIELRPKKQVGISTEKIMTDPKTKKRYKIRINPDGSKTNLGEYNGQ